MQPSCFIWNFWGLFQRTLVGNQIHDSPRITAGFHQREQIFGPPAHVALPHAQLELLVEHRQERQGIGLAAIGSPY
jgi:hypothetical protein